MEGRVAEEKLTNRTARGYLSESQRPLSILVFLLPLLAAYELGAWLYLSGGEHGPTTIAAWGMLARFFETFGVIGIHLPALLLVTVLLVWHMLVRERWRVRPMVLVGMAMEACVWTVPLTILLIVLQSALTGEAAPPVAAQVTDPEGLRNLSWQTRLTISAGAGLYEELLFRMIAIAAIHALLPLRGPSPPPGPPTAPAPRWRSSFLLPPLPSTTTRLGAAGLSGCWRLCPTSWRGSISGCSMWSGALGWWWRCIFYTM